LRIWSRFICQIWGQRHGCFRKRPAMPHSVSPRTIVYVSGAFSVKTSVDGAAARRTGVAGAAGVAVG
jgi:hypothetical protein